VQSIHLLTDEKRAYFAERQEAVRKDVERYLGVLQACFAIIRNPSRFWNMETISVIMFTCYILHNMIVEDEEDVPNLEDIITELQNPDLGFERGLTFDQLLSGTRDLQSVYIHHGLRNDLLEHLWTLKGQNLA
jgi:hypothetical protein